MINLLKSFFKKRAYTFLGKGGISFRYEGCEYYIDTNNFLGNNYGVEIFYKDIRLINNSLSLTDLEKKKIAFKVKNILEKDKVDVTITPSLSTDFITENS